IEIAPGTIPLLSRRAPFLSRIRGTFFLRLGTRQRLLSGALRLRRRLHRGRERTDLAFERLVRLREAAREGGMLLGSLTIFVRHLCVALPRRGQPTDLRLCPLEYQVTGPVVGERGDLSINALGILG